MRGAKDFENIRFTHCYFYVRMPPGISRKLKRKVYHLYSLFLFVNTFNLAVTLLILHKIAALEEDLARKTSINHDVTQTIPTRKRNTFP